MTNLYNHPRYRDIKYEAERIFNQCFNEVSLDDAEEAAKRENGYLQEYIKEPSFAVKAEAWIRDTLSTEEETKLYTEFLEDTVPEPSFIYEAEDAIGNGEYQGMSTESVAELLEAKWLLARDGEIAALKESRTDELYEWLEDNKESEVQDHFEESVHYPMWSTLFECRGKEDYVDELYDLGIGVIEPFGNYDSMLFIAGCGYDFYEAHWIPMLNMLGWLEISRFVDPEQKLTCCAHCGNKKFWVNKCVEYQAEAEEVQGGEAVLKAWNGEAPKISIRCRNCGTEHFESNFKSINFSE